MADSDKLDLPDFAAARMFVVVRVGKNVGTIDIVLDKLLCNIKTREEFEKRAKQLGLHFNEDFTTLPIRKD
jgi:hypothetical protein